jgi:hypothetical protein
LRYPNFEGSYLHSYSHENLYFCHLLSCSCIPTGAGDLPLLLNIQTGSGALHQPPIQWVLGSLSCGQSGWGVKLIILHLVLRLRISGAVLQLIMHVFMLCMETALPVYGFTEYMCYTVMT